LAVAASIIAFTFGIEAPQLGRDFSLQVCLTKSMTMSAVVFASSDAGLSAGAGGGAWSNHRRCSSVPIRRREKQRAQ